VAEAFVQSSTTRPASVRCCRGRRRSPDYNSRLHGHHPTPQHRFSPGRPPRDRIRHPAVVSQTGVIDDFFPSLAVNSSTLSINQDKLLPRAWQTPGKKSRNQDADPTNHIHCSEFSCASLSDRGEQPVEEFSGRYCGSSVVLETDPEYQPSMSRTGAPFLTSVSYPPMPPNGAPGRVLRYTPYHGSCRDLLMSQSRGLDSIYKTCGLFIPLLFLFLHRTGPDPKLRAMLC
jgi:hypothetical protein